MTPAELYLRTPEEESKDLSILKGYRYDHLPETGEPGCSFEGNERVTIKYYKLFNFDGRRFWCLASVWFDDLPFMIIQNAGREGDDWHQRFVTNHQLYAQAIMYLRSFVTIIAEGFPITPLDQDIPELTSFYGNSLDGYFERY